ncbi:MAG: sugar phosphate nucleotidyltransferase [Nanoarchaeota archaeon]
MVRVNPLSFVLAGGRGLRLQPLTLERAKPSVPFGASYRVIDFVLSNLYHSGMRKIHVLTQYMSESLQEHLEDGWSRNFGKGSEEFLKVRPAMQGSDRGWFKGTADSLYQHLHLIDRGNHRNVDVFGADHIYLMDVSQMNGMHNEREADLTISAIPVPIDLARGNYGVLVVDEDWRLVSFQEKPDEPVPMPGDPTRCLASMGNYVFRRPALIEALVTDAGKTYTTDNDALRAGDRHDLTSHDIAHDLIRDMMKRDKRIFVYDFSKNEVPGVPAEQRGFWRDIGDLDQLYQANMEVRDVKPLLNLYNPEWHIMTNVVTTTPSKTVHDGRALESIVANGVIVSGSLVERSVVGYNCRVIDGSYVGDSLLLGDNNIGSGSRIRRAILDKGVCTPHGTVIGEDQSVDKARGFSFSDKGIPVVPKGYMFKQGSG